MRLCFVGHITRDRVRIGQAKEKIQTGGAAWYGAQAAAALGAEVRVVTRMASADQSTVSRELRDLGIQVDIYPSSRTTEFLNVYDGPESQNRTQWIESVADPFEDSDLRLETDAFIFGPLTRIEMSEHLVRRAGESALIALDIQGLVRTSTTGRVFHAANPDLGGFVAGCDVVKAGEDEALIASGTSTLEGAVDWFLSHGASEVLITMGPHGSLAATPFEREQIPAYRFDALVDTTGCGDIYLAAYMVKRIAGEKVSEAAHAASAAAGLSATRPSGAPLITSADVESVVGRAAPTRSARRT